MAPPIAMTPPILIAGREEGRPSSGDGTSMKRGAAWCGLFVFLAILGKPLRAEEIAWLHDTETAWRQTVSQDRPLLLFVTRAQCKYCAQMKKFTFADEQVRELVNGGFVPLAVDPTSDAELIKELKITAYPTTLVISPDEGLLDQFKGYLPPAEFARRLNRHRVQAAAAPARSSRR
jgi:thioredoxin-related protein